MTRRTAAATALLVLLALCPLPSIAHETDPAVVAVLDAVTPPLPPGVRVVVGSSIAPQLVVENPTDTPLSAVSEAGEEFLRVSSTGVEANLGSQAWYDSNAPSGRGARLRGPSERRFARVRAESTWGWFDHRLHPAAAAVPVRVRAAKRRARLADWSVPLRYGATDIAVHGHLEYRPLLGRIATAVTSTLPSGVELTTVDGRLPGIFLRNSTGKTLRVLGPAGELFAEIRPDAVIVNTESLVQVEDARAKGVGAPDARRPTGPMLQVASGPTYSWLDLRLRYQQPAAPDEVQHRRVPTVLVRWVIPIEVADERFLVTGTTSFVPFATAGPPVGRGSRHLAAWFAALAAVGVAGVAVLRHRASYDRADREGGP